MRFRAPANVQLHRAQVILILGALVPTILTTLLGIILLATESGTSSVALVTGILVLAFCASSLTGYILGSIFLRRGAMLAKVQSDFLSAVSHELRTPMTSMRMFVEALQDDRLTDPEERVKCLQTLHREMGRLDDLVGRLIELSRIESGGQPFEMRPTAVRDVVDSAVTAFDAINVHRDSELQVDMKSDLKVMGNKAALTQVLVNLLSNAWKYTTAGNKKITLEVSAASDRDVEIAVHDNGPGIPPEEQKRIFEKFERGAAATETGTAGSGLGLAVVQAIVGAHYGRVELKSSPRGSCFRIFIPRSKTA